MEEFTCAVVAIGECVATKSLGYMYAEAGDVAARLATNPWPIGSATMTNTIGIVDGALESVHFADARTGWAAGWGGTILATHDGGSNWQPQKSGTDETLCGVHFVTGMTSGPIHAYSAAKAGVIQLTTNLNRS